MLHKHSQAFWPETPSAGKPGGFAQTHAEDSPLAGLQTPACLTAGSGHSLLYRVQAPRCPQNAHPLPTPVRKGHGRYAEVRKQNAEKLLSLSLVTKSVAEPGSKPRRSTQRLHSPSFCFQYKCIRRGGRKADLVHFSCPEANCIKLISHTRMVTEGP